MLEILKYANAYVRARMSEKAQGMVEYALIIAFVVAIAVYLTNSGGLGGAISNVFSSAAKQISSPSK